jgi:hypothetical protein
MRTNLWEVQASEISAASKNYENEGADVHQEWRQIRLHESAVLKTDEVLEDGTKDGERTVP